MAQIRSLIGLEQGSELYQVQILKERDRASRSDPGILPRPEKVNECLAPVLQQAANTSLQGQAG